MLVELDHNLPYLNGVAGLHPDVLDCAPDRRRDIGFHLHGFHHQQQIVGLNLLSVLCVAADNNPGGNGLGPAAGATGAPFAAEAGGAYAGYIRG